MIEITHDEFEKNFESYMDRVEKNREVFLVRLPDERGVVVAPIDEETEKVFDYVVDKNYVPEITD